MITGGDKEEGGQEEGEKGGGGGIEDAKEGDMHWMQGGGRELILHCWDSEG